ncbi:metal ABC transporter permease [Sphingorhabdus lutea]|uniref:Metal ABC transporter permease n=1 Tax=Sphingorhabdus lutea TaxID=1913578 RepID=A0A1L3JAC9_9SPHN|nr:metal ABC transporter permease [Sphingorhabdus lutea]
MSPSMHHHIAPPSGQAEPELLPTLKRFLPFLWPKGEREIQFRIILAAIMVLCAKAAVLSMPFAYKAIVDSMAGDANNINNIGQNAPIIIIMTLLLAYGGARFGQVLFDNLRNFIFEKVGQRAGQLLAVTVFSHLHKLSLRFHLQRRTGEVTKIVERGTKSIDVMLYFLLFNIAPTIIELSAVLIIFYINFGLPLVIGTMLMVAFYIFYTRKVTDWRNKLREEMNDMDTRAIGRSVDALLNYETVKYFTAEQRETARYETSMREYAAAATKSENSLAALNVGQALITNIALIGAMAFVIWGWKDGSFTVGDMVLVNGLLMQLFRPLDLLGMVYRTIRQGLIDMGAMFALLDRQPEIIDPDCAPNLHVNGGEVIFDNVRFSYDDREILKGLSFTLPAGQTLAIVGPSGAGKSTIGRLLFRFYEPQSGHIYIDGQDIASVTQNSLRASIGIVPQDTVLFNDSIGYNIAYGREGAGHDDVVNAAKAAAIDGFISQLSGGYETQVGERGLKLSGGEKQRVAIARTILKNPPILLLDEATSALDSKTEAQIQSTLKSISERRTTLIIAHRLSTITHADQIIVLDKGKVAEHGKHHKLLAAGGIYAKLWQQQAQDREQQ